MLPPPDHPRACGANVASNSSEDPVNGSSPRVRGKLIPVPVFDVLLRIIPARAGQTCLLAVMVVILSDHPRACGANRMAAAI